MIESKPVKRTENTAPTEGSRRPHCDQRSLPGGFKRFDRQLVTVTGYLVVKFNVSMCQW